MANACRACGKPLALFEDCTCGRGPSLVSKRNPVNLDVRAIAMLVASPVLAVIGLMQLSDPQADHGRAMIGLGARDTLRLEMGYMLYGNDIDDTTHPLEAGIGWTVKLKKGDFIGRDALIKRKENPRHILVGLDIDSTEGAGHGDCIHIGRAQIGAVTSACRSPILKKSIALARVEAIHAAVGTEVEIGKLDGHQKRLPAKIVSLSHYDPQKTRPRS